MPCMERVGLSKGRMSTLVTELGLWDSWTLLSKGAVDNQFTDRLVNVEAIWVTGPYGRIEESLKWKEKDISSHIPRNVAALSCASVFVSFTSFSIFFPFLQINSLIKL